ncbi:MAG: hypothetical protein H7327_06510 [Herminiimonas sp.]|nr:hypothetical protein [Herminiimonas sp.]
MNTTKFLATLLVTAFALPVFAQTATPAIGQTQRNQESRIAEGVRSGELTRPEAQKLQQQQQVIRADKRAAKADGVVTGAERRKIKREQAKANRSIYRKKHNGRTA